MSELIIYGDYISQPARAVLSFCEITGIPYTLKEIRVFKGDHLSSSYKQINPSQTVPAMTHEGLTLYESHAILVYLATRFDKLSWYPSDLQQRAQVDCYLHWHHLHIRFSCGMYLFNKLAAPLIYGKSFPDIESMALIERVDTFNMVESILSQGLYVGRTPEPSIADIACYCEIEALMLVNVDLSKYPNIRNWMNTIGSIDGVKRVNERYYKIMKRPKI